LGFGATTQADWNRPVTAKNDAHVLLLAKKATLVLLKRVPLLARWIELCWQKSGGSSRHGWFEKLLGL